MAAKFGTSGLRGLVGELTDGTAAAHARAFARHLKQARNGETREHHSSSGATDVPRARTLRHNAPRRCLTEGLEPVDCGVLPTPALALYAMGQNAGALMITGSHIPDDRNGVKFYRPDGEIDKDRRSRYFTSWRRTAWGWPHLQGKTHAGPVILEASAAFHRTLSRVCPGRSSERSAHRALRTQLRGEERPLQRFFEAEGVRDHPVRQFAGLHSGRHRGRIRGNPYTGFRLGSLRRAGRACFHRWRRRPADGGRRERSRSFAAMRWG
jgi:hypothetical protein